jgi:hypothetical protein
MKKLSLVIVLLLLFCIGCYKNKPCPAFLPDLNYFPYYHGQKIKFVNLQQDTCIFTITNEIPQEVSESKLCYMRHICRLYPNQDDGSIIFDLLLTGSKITVGEFHIYAYIYLPNDNKESICITPIKLRDHARITYKKVGKYLDDIIVYEDENNKTIKKLVIVKNKGLASYTTADGEEWRLVE